MMGVAMSLSVLGRFRRFEGIGTYGIQNLKT